MMRKKKYIYITAAAVMSMMLFAGCSNANKEKQAAYRQIGINDMESGDYAGAVDAFNSALGQCVGKISADELDICYYKAAAQFAAGDTDGAAATYTAVIEYDAKEADAYYLRGCLYLKQGNTDGAAADFENAIKYNSGDYDLYIHIYENLSGYGMAENGEEYLNRALDIKGSDAKDYESRGRIHYYLGQYDKAEEELKSAIEKQSVTANLYLAQVYEAAGDTENAQTYYENYVNSGETDSAAMNALGEIEMGKGNYSGALTYLEQGIAMENVSNRRALMQNLIICYEYTGDFASAWNMVQEYVQDYPDDANAQREYIFLKNRVEQTEDTTAPEGGDTGDTAASEDVPEDTSQPEQ